MSVNWNIRYFDPFAVHPCRDRKHRTKENRERCRLILKIHPCRPALRIIRLDDPMTVYPGGPLDQDQSIWYL